jgi:tetratricopeptide (TPR) repeat protein
VFRFRTSSSSEWSVARGAWWGAGTIVVSAALWVAFVQFSDLKGDYNRGDIDVDRRILQLQEQADALLKKGAGDNRALAAAIGLRERIVTLMSREKAPLDWAAAEHDLGDAQFRLGERESVTARLQNAIAAYRAALQERTHDRTPFDWATTENSLGAALEALGAREGGTARLEEAAVALRAALEVRSRDRVPIEWATTENNLGIALEGLGKSENLTARPNARKSGFRPSETFRRTAQR